jgi:hypothetical protein
MYLGGIEIKKSFSFYFQSIETSVLCLNDLGNKIVNKNRFFFIMFSPYLFIFDAFIFLR